MIIDMHTHTSGVSRCCRVDYKTMLWLAKGAGLDGAVLTNHYQKSYLKYMSSAEYIDRYIAEYEAAREYGKALGLKVFFGIEVTSEPLGGLHLLIYGVTPDFLRAHPALYDLGQKDLFDLTHRYGGMLVQAHPLRYGEDLLNPAFLDGVEVSCHPKYSSAYYEKLSLFAREHRLILTCGGDYHGDTGYRPICGTYLPETVENSVEIVEYFKCANALRLRVHEVGEKTFEDKEFYL